MSREAVEYVRGLGLPPGPRELPGGRTEIVFGPACDAAPPGPGQAAEMPGRKDFAMPGWEDYSTWGYEQGTGFWAQLWRNADDPDAGPRIWITPARNSVTSVSGLARAIARELAVCEAVPPARRRGQDVAARLACRRPSRPLPSRPGAAGGPAGHPGAR